MKTWKIHEAKAKFSEMLKQGAKEPQIIMNREKEVGVLISFAQFVEFQKLAESNKKPTLAELIEELDELGPLKNDFPDTKRNNRRDWTEE